MQQNRLTPILDRELLGTWGAIKQKIENQNASSLFLTT